MNNLFILYSALAAFGVGVTIVDLFGIFDHFSGSAGGDHDGGHDAGHDGSHDDSQTDDSSSHDDTGNEAGHHDAISDHSTHDSQIANGHHAATHDTHAGSYVASADSGTRIVAKTLGLLRSGVYFSLGAGLTGLFALLTKVSAVPSLLWSAGAGVFIMISARALRSFIRKDLDSSLKPEEFLMETGIISVSLLPGAMGKIIVRHSDLETELYVRAKDTSLNLKKGSTARIVDYTDECYWIEPEL